MGVERRVGDPALPVSGSVTTAGAGASIALGSALMALSPFASARTLDEIIASKKIVFGVNPTLPPLGIFNDKLKIDANVKGSVSYRANMPQR